MRLGALALRASLTGGVVMFLLTVVHTTTSCSNCTDNPTGVYGKCCSSRSDCISGVACEDGRCCSDGKDSGRRCSQDTDCCSGLTCHQVDADGSGLGFCR